MVTFSMCVVSACQSAAVPGLPFPSVTTQPAGIAAADASSGYA
jgi:hypothetical protein